MNPSPPATAIDRRRTNSRILEFDALRVVALCLILAVHSDSYIPELPVLDWLRDWLRQAGLGIFFSCLAIAFSIHCCSAVSLGSAANF